MRIIQKSLFILLISLVFSQNNNEVGFIYFVDGDCIIENNYVNVYSKKALQGRKLYDGDVIKVKDNSFCSIRFADNKTNIDIFSNSSIKIFDNNTREILVIHGSIYVENIHNNRKKVYVFTSNNHVFVDHDRIWLETNELYGDKFVTIDKEMQVYNLLSKSTRIISPNLIHNISIDGSMTKDTEISFLPEYVKNDMLIDRDHDYEIDLKKNDLIPIYGERLHNTQSRNPYNLSFGLGANSIADTNYIKIGVYPSYKKNNFFIGMKLESYINPDGENIKDDWDDFFDLFDKTSASYEHINNKNEMYFYFGQNRSGTSFAQGYLLNNLNKSINQPKLRNSGFYLKYVFDKDFMDLNIVVPSLRDFSNSGGGLIGARTSLYISHKFPLTLGVGVVADLDQFSFLSDKLNKPVKIRRDVYGFEFDFNYELISNLNFEVSLFSEFVGIWYPQYNYYLIFNDNNFQNDLKWRKGVWGVKGPGVKVVFSNRYEMKFALNYNSATFIPGYFDATYNYNKVRYYKNNNLTFPLVQEQIDLIENNFAVESGTGEYLIPKDVYPILFKNDGFSPHKVFGFTTEHLYSIHKYIEMSFLGSLFVENSDEKEQFYSLETSVRINDKFIRNLSFLDIYYSNMYFSNFSDTERLIFGIKSGIKLPYRLNLIINLSQVYYDSNLSNNVIDSMINLGLDIKYKF